MTNVINIDNYRRSGEATSEGTGKNSGIQQETLSLEKGNELFENLLNSKNPNLTGDEIVALLKNVLSTYGDEGFAKFMNWIQQEPSNEITFTRKSTIFSIAHFVLYKKELPTAHLLYAMHLANQSKDTSTISTMQGYLNAHLNFDQIDELITIGKNLISAGWMTAGELDIIEVQLTTHGRQRVLLFN